MGGVFLSRHGEKRSRSRFGYNRNMESVLVEKNISFAKISSPYEIIMGLIECASQRKKENTITRCRACSAQRSLDHWGLCHVSCTRCLACSAILVSGEAIRLNLNLGQPGLGHGGLLSRFPPNWGCSWFQGVGTADWMICIWNCWRTYSLHTNQLVFCSITSSSSLLLHRGLQFSQWQKLCPLLLQQHSG